MIPILKCLTSLVLDPVKTLLSWGNSLTQLLQEISNLPQNVQNILLSVLFLQDIKDNIKHAYIDIYTCKTHNS